MKLSVIITVGYDARYQRPGIVTDVRVNYNIMKLEPGKGLNYLIFFSKCIWFMALSMIYDLLTFTLICYYNLPIV